MHIVLHFDFLSTFPDRQMKLQVKLSATNYNILMRNTTKLCRPTTCRK